MYFEARRENIDDVNNVRQSRLVVIVYMRLLVPVLRCMCQSHTVYSYGQSYII